jgi:hypothetical protein
MKKLIFLLLLLTGCAEYPVYYSAQVSSYTPYQPYMYRREYVPAPPAIVITPQFQYNPRYRFNRPERFYHFHHRRRRY